MSEAPVQISAELEIQPVMPVRRLNNYVFCPRLFYFQWVENLFQESADTVAGSSAHRNVDAPSRVEEEKAKALADNLSDGARLRSLQLESETLGIVGVMDLVEGGPDGAQIVDYKKGSPRHTDKGEVEAREPEAIQVGAYALLLQEAGVKVSGAVIYYAAEKKRVPMEVSEELLNKTRLTISEAKKLATSGQCPPPLKSDQRCLGCSAYPICLPGESAFWAGKGDEKALKIETPPRPENDEAEVLIVQTPGAMVGHRGGQITVHADGETLRKLPAHQVRAIYLYGAVQLSTQAAHECLNLGIDVSYFSPAGRFLGMLRGLQASGIDARIGQYRLYDQPAMRLELAKSFIRAKIHNQRVLLMRNGEAQDKTLDQMEKLRGRTAEAADMTQLLGMEGMAAALYFENFKSMFKQDMKFDFNGRNRHPPRDPVNAMLSFGYSMLSKELTGICYSVGLDPFVGFMHQPRYGRPALALDLMEEFRPLIVDSVVISLINRNEVAPSDFASTARGTMMNEHGRRAFWENYARRMDTEVAHPQFGYKMAYRRMLDVQARRIWRFLRGEASSYVGFTTR